MSFVSICNVYILLWNTWAPSGVIDSQNIFVTSLLLLRITTMIYAVNSFISCDRFGFSRLQTIAATRTLQYKTVWRNNNNMSRSVVIVAPYLRHSMVVWRDGPIVPPLIIYFTNRSCRVNTFLPSLCPETRRNVFAHTRLHAPTTRTLSHNHSRWSGESSLCTAKAFRHRHYR